MFHKRYLKTVAYFVLLFLLLAALPGSSARASVPQAVGFILLSAGRDGVIGTDDDIYVTGNREVVKGKVDLAALGLTQGDLIPSSGEAPAQGDTAFVPASIVLMSDKASAPADGATAVTLTATVEDSSGQAVSGVTVRFETTLGVINPQEATTDQNGTAKTVLSSSTAGTAKVRASVGNLSAECDVVFLASNISEVEPNDSMNQAQEITIGQTVEGYIGYTDPSSGYRDSYDWYKITIPVDGRLEINYNSDSAYAELSLYNSNGNYITSSGVSKSAPIMSDLAAGTYYIQVYYNSGNPAGYTLTTGLTPSHQVSVYLGCYELRLEGNNVLPATKYLRIYQDGVRKYQLAFTSGTIVTAYTLRDANGKLCIDYSYDSYLYSNGVYTYWKSITNSFSTNFNVPCN
ncbi:hypothetical protein E308F_16630 [Moorella sp. E308F]|uniref:Ig-like domain-containing protein n=1 Tax=unclassified Neomoorella TaxID=2676739 RepID=UPI0010FFAE47|nr:MULTISPECIES: Ig-like domain-containing protein [unclassified Moorella (in: firmicutes)]GEA15419.1 hypothetical protein E308F_16630 [Moorella sp. E308F]GEA19721.1 hypothetical protein E306M_28600 [Moorella sp. E306M]